MIVGPRGDVAGQRQLGNEHTAFDLFVRRDVGNILHEQVSCANFDVVAIVAQPLEVRAKTYLFL